MPLKIKSAHPHFADQCFQHPLGFPGSLTQRLRAAAKKSFHVESISEIFAPITLDDQLDYLAPVGQWCWKREVKLMVDNECWVRGTTWIPLTSLQGAARQLLTLKNRPLGDVLFRDPHLQRSEFIFDADGQTRTSMFYFFGQPLAVRENFANAFEKTF